MEQVSFDKTIKEFLSIFPKEMVVEAVKKLYLCHINDSNDFEKTFEFMFFLICTGTYSIRHEISDNLVNNPNLYHSFSQF